jgi:predicted transcriptional regulator
MLKLSPLEYAAFFILLKRQPLFKWEREALTDSAIRSLEKKGLVVLEGQQWQVTEQGRSQVMSLNKFKRT